MTTPSAPLNQQLKHVANVIITDEQHSVFGELIDPNVVLSALRQFESSEGKLDDPFAASAMTALHSVNTRSEESGGNDICLEIDNVSDYILKIRWMDEQGHNDPSQFLWTLQPHSSWVQWTTGGHLMLLTVQIGSEESILGAYRPWKRLPSGSTHSLLVEGQTEISTSSAETPSFFLETVLTDNSHEDTILVAAAALDPVEAGGDSSGKTLTILGTILQNLANHPAEEKYRHLRLSNPKIQQFIASSWGAMHLLHVVGFQEQTLEGEIHLMVPTSRSINLQVLQIAQKWLDVLQGRASNQFVAELALSVPWQRPVVQGGGSQHWSRAGRGTRFVTPDERWARTERVNRNRASGRAHRPNPGEAPSSRGKWGR